MKRKLLAILILAIGIFFAYNYINKDTESENATKNPDNEVRKMEEREKEEALEEEKLIEDKVSEEIDLVTAFKYPILLDSHNDTMMKVVDEDSWLPSVDLGGDTSFAIDIGKLKKGGLNIPFFAAYTEGYYDNTEKSISRTLALINALYFTEANNSSSFKIAKSIEDIVEGVNEGKISAVATIEGGYSLDEDHSLELLNQYKDLGIKAIGLTWNYSNKLGEGASKIYGDSGKTPSSGGLTELGEKIVREMNRLGIIVDVSHMDDDTFWDVMEISRAPIIASHSGVDKIKTHNRNLTDEQLQALVENGGVISIVFYPGFLKDGDVYISDMVDHIDYVVNLIGVDHVGIGSDFDGARMPIDLKDSGEIYKIREELEKRAYSESDIDKILGKNVLRVLKETEDKAARTDNILDIEIIPSFNMGEKIDGKTPILRAKVEGDLDIEKVSLIVDGIRYAAIYDRADRSISLEIKDPLKEKFHVATFEVETIDGDIKRETRIFYID